MNLGFATRCDDLLGFGYGTAQRLFAKNMFARFGARPDLLDMCRRRAGDINGIDVRGK